MPHPSLPQNPLHLPGAQAPPSPAKGIRAEQSTGIRISTQMMDQLGDPTRPAGYTIARSDDGDRKRRRSPSPYEHRSPRARYRSPARSRSRSPSPSVIPPSSFYTRSAHPVHSRTGQGQIPPPPGALEHAVSFKHFSDWLRGAWPKLVFRDEEDRGGNAMGKRYDAYRRIYYQRQLVSLFLAHRESAWFIERYSEVQTHVATRKRLNREGRVPRARAFLEALGRGDYDDVTYDQEQPTNGESSRRRGSPNELDEDGNERDKEREDDASNGQGVEGDDRVVEPASPFQLFVKTIPPSASRKDLEKMFKTVGGLRYLAISEPSAKKSYHRVAWAQYADGTDMDAAVKATDGQQIDSFTYHVVQNLTPAIGKRRLTAPVANTLPRLERDLQLARELAKKLEAELLFDATIEGEGETEGLDGSVWERVEEKIMAVWMREGLEAEDILDDEGRARRARLALDQYLNYLRKGLNTCYYCVAPLSHSESLNRSCISHIRPRQGTVAPEPEVESRKTPDQRWVETLESKICLLLDGEEGELRTFVKRHKEEEIRRLCAPLIRQESANKYACTECNKMFKAPEYVIKHIPTKHREIMADVLEQIAYFHAFVMDPNKISPLPSTPGALSFAIPKPSYATNGASHYPVPASRAAIAQPMAHSGAWNPAMFPGIVPMNGPHPILPPRPVAPLPPAPAGNEDPRAKRGRVSYMDLDESATADEGGLPY